MERLCRLVLLLFLGLCVTGCESARKAFSNKKMGPDEFLVYARPPLSQPPDFRLRPPRPGKQAKTISAVNQAKKAILSGTEIKRIDNDSKQPSSPGTEAFLRNTGADSSNPQIRRLINEETTIYSDEDKRFVDKLIFWVEDKPFEGSVIDPSKEQRRLREAQALGKSINDGQTIHIKRKRKKKGLLEF